MPYISATAEIIYAPLDLRFVKGSLAPLGISPAGSRFAHARKPAQHVCTLGFAFSHRSESITKERGHGFGGLTRISLSIRVGPCQSVASFYAAVSDFPVDAAQPIGLSAC